MNLLEFWERARSGRAGDNRWREDLLSGRRSREPSEEASGQTAAVVEHDAGREPADVADLIRNHSVFYHGGVRRDNQTTGGVPDR